MAVRGTGLVPTIESGPTKVPLGEVTGTVPATALCIRYNRLTELFCPLATETDEGLTLTAAYTLRQADKVTKATRNI